MTTFGLVHGAFHGAWCWKRLVPELEARGHRALTVDLPIEDPSAGAEAYAAAAIAAFGDVDDLVLVGHSIGGLVIPVIAQARPVRGLAFLCALLPRPGRSHDDVLAEEADMALPGPQDATYQSDDGATHWRPEAAEHWFFADCPRGVAVSAARRLRGQFWLVAQEVTPLRAWPDVARQYILGVTDPAINPEWSRRAARDVLGVEAVELDTGHSPFLSDPGALAAALDTAWPANAGFGRAAPATLPDVGERPAAEEAEAGGAGEHPQGAAKAPASGARKGEAKSRARKGRDTAARGKAIAAAADAAAAPAAPTEAEAEAPSGVETAEGPTAPAAEAAEAAPAGQVAEAVEAPPPPEAAPAPPPPATAYASPEDIDEAILDYLCLSRRDADERLEAMGLAGFERVLELSTPEGWRDHPLPPRADMPSGREAADAWRGALLTVVTAVEMLLTHYDVAVTDEQIRWVCLNQTRAGIRLIRALGRQRPDRARGLCEWLLDRVYLANVAGRERKLDPWDREDAERLLDELSAGVAN